MTQIPKSHQDLLEKCQVVALATISDSPHPQVTAVWFAVDEGGTVVMSLNTTRRKVQNLEQHPDCTLFFIDPDTPYRTLEIRARADVQPDTGFAVVNLITAKYGDDVRARDKPGEGRVAVRFTPVKVNTYG